MKDLRQRVVVANVALVECCAGNSAGFDGLRAGLGIEVDQMDRPLFVRLACETLGDGQPDTTGCRAEDRIKGRGWGNELARAACWLIYAVADMDRESIMPRVGGRPTVVERSGVV